MVTLQRHAASGFGVERASRLCHESAQLQQCWEQVNHGDPYTEGQPEGLRKQTKQQFSLGLGVLLVHFCVCLHLCMHTYMYFHVETPEGHQKSSLIISTLYLEAGSLNQAQMSPDSN